MVFCTQRLPWVLLCPRWSSIIAVCLQKRVFVSIICQASASNALNIQLAIENTSSVNVSS